ncbi:hypothetical protein NQ314_020594 [Rhamnusium bicolor]|uniref:Uncharacterized protein n=1 Tax=Rhamnusium bicolor TaxID=1586634 RepID=A0AAV8WKR6_9CUCU|nr:hypothetical protein NQ314_020594 [Rhamnusium bicolor]
MRVTTEHWKRFLEIAEENPELTTNQFCGSNGKAKLNTLWQSVVNSLNYLGYGEKSVAECRKVIDGDGEVAELGLESQVLELDPESETLDPGCSSQNENISDYNYHEITSRGRSKFKTIY